MIKEIEKTMGCTDRNCIARGWIIKYDSKDQIREIKSLFNPKEYKGARPVYSDFEIVEILKKYKKK